MVVQVENLSALIGRIAMPGIHAEWARSAGHRQFCHLSR
jgi:hypothetical protein